MRLLLTFAFCSLTISVHSQTTSNLSIPESQIICNYRLTYKPDSSSSNARVENMILTIGKTVSKFESKGFAARDSLLKIGFNPNKPNATQGMIDALSSLPQTKFKYSIYKNTVENKLYCYDRIGYGSLYVYKEASDVFDWHILANQKLVISGFNCQKAITTYAGRNYEAWFTREIPISEGPYKFYGLPGLIISLSDTKQQYNFQLVKLSKATSITSISLPIKQAKVTTRAELRQAQTDFALGELDRVAAMGNNISEEDKRMRRDKIKRENNPIEIR